MTKQNEGKQCNPLPCVDRVAYSVAEFCASLGIGRTTFYQEVAARRIHVAKCGRRTLVPASERQAWLHRLGGE
jgi:excisionase family DNA binding protein